MGMRDIKCYGKPKPRSRFIEISRMIQPHKRPERVFAVFSRNAGPIIINKDGEQAVFNAALHFHIVGITDGVAQKI